MHRVLSMPELVGCICEVVDRRDAYTMALTCRTWHSAALDRIWRDLTFGEIMTHLFCLLPSNVYKPPEVRMHSHYLPWGVALH